MEMDALIHQWFHESLVTHQRDVLNGGVAILEIIDIQVEIGVVVVLDDMLIDNAVEVHDAEAMSGLRFIAGHSDLHLEAVVVAVPIRVAAFAEYFPIDLVVVFRIVQSM